MDKQPMMDFDDSWLSAYLDNELTREQSRYVEELLRSRPDLQRTLDGLIRVRSAIASCRFELPDDSRIVCSGPWDAPKPSPSSSSERSTRTPTWLFSLAATILVLATLSSLVWLSRGNRSGGMLATRMAPQAKMQHSTKQEATRSSTGENRMQEMESQQETAPAGNSPMVATDSVHAPSAIVPPAAASSLPSDPSQAASNLAFRSEQDAIESKTTAGDFFAYFLHLDVANKDAIDPLPRKPKDFNRSEDTNTPFSLRQKAPGDHSWYFDANAQEFGRSTLSEEAAAIVWFQPTTQAAKGESSSDKQFAGRSRGELAEATPASPLPRLRTNPTPPKVLEIRIPVDSWSQSTPALREKGFEIPEDFKPGDYRFEAIQNEGNPERPWSVRKLEAIRATEEDRTPAYFSLIVIPAKPPTKSGSSE